MASKERDIALQLRALAADPENRPYIVKQGCLPGLVMFLSSADAEIVQIALEALQFMSLYKGHKSVMAKEEGLAPALRKLMLSTNAKVKATALTVYTNIQEDIPPASVPRPSDEGAPAVAAEVSKVGSARTYHLYIKDLTNDDLKQKIESVLLGVKGVLSFLIDTCARKAVVRTLSPVDALTGAIRGAGFCITKVDEHGDPSKTYKAPCEEKENSAGGQGGGNGQQGGWFSGMTSWLVATEDQGSSWFGAAKKKKPEQTGTAGRLGKLFWG